LHKNFFNKNFLEIPPLLFAIDFAFLQAFQNINQAYYLLREFIATKKKIFSLAFRKEVQRQKWVAYILLSPFKH